MAEPIDLKDLVKRFLLRNANVQGLQELALQADAVTIEQIPHGFVNYVFILRTPDCKHSAVIKHGKETGNSEILAGQVLSLDRGRCEYNSLWLLNKMIPGCAAQPFCHDSEMNIVAMEYLEGKKTLGEDLLTGKIDVDMIAKIGHNIGYINYHTNEKIMDSSKWEQMKKDYSKNNMKQIFGKIVLENAFSLEEDPFYIRVEGIGDEWFNELVGTLKKEGLIHKLWQIYYTPTCFTHGDFYGSACMVDDEEAKMIDLELSGPGAPSFDLGLMVITLMFFPWNHFFENPDDPGSGNKMWRKMRSSLDVFMQSYYKAYEEDLAVLGENWISEFALMFGDILFCGSRFRSFELLVDISPENKKKMFTNGFDLMMRHTEVKNYNEIFDIALSGLHP